MIVFLNGKFLDEKKAAISLHDHGFLYGDGVYETLRVYKGRAFLLENHLKRLRHSLDGIGLKKLPWTWEEIGWAIEETARRNRQPEAVVRLTITRGPGLYGFDPALCDRPTIAIVSKPFTAYPAFYHTKGITAAVLSVRRNSPFSLPPHVKSTSCMNGILGKMDSLKKGAHEGLFLTLDGFIAEGTVSNIFLVRKGVIYTPALDGHLLAGVTRGFVCELARSVGYRVREEKIPGSALISADELFFTNTTMEVLPISTLVMGRKYRKSVGSITKILMNLFKGELRRNAKLRPS
jgi:branched-chain amino acid aminotransferase